MESQTARTWSHRFGKQERYVIRWTAPGDTSTVGWAQLKKLHDAVASDPATQTIHRQQPRAATDECAAAAFSALTGSTVSSDQLRYRYPACVTRTDEGHGFTVTIPVRYRSIEVSVYLNCCALVELLAAECASSGGLDPYPHRCGHPPAHTNLCGFPAPSPFAPHTHTHAYVSL